jgi:hypothetical protein
MEPNLSQSQIRLHISEEDNLALDDKTPGFLTQISNRPLENKIIQTNQIKNFKSKWSTNNLKVSSNKKRSQQQIYIEYLKEKIQQESESRNKQRGLLSERRLNVTSENNSDKIESENVTSHSTPEFVSTTLPIVNNRFRPRVNNNLKYRNQFNSKSLTFNESKRQNNSYQNNKYLQKNKTIIDLNSIGKSSFLSRHYLFEKSEIKNQGDLSLSDRWPRSEMCLLSQKKSPWVNAQREKSFANELNSYFRFQNDFPYENHLQQIKSPLRILPSIKQIL